MIPQSGRSVARLPQLRLQCLSNSRRGFGSCHPQRVAIVHSNLQSQNLFDLVHHDFSGKPMPHRTYATKPVSRPKAHTGRTTAARKAPTTSKTAAAKKPAAKKTSPKPRPTAKSTAKLRTRAKPKRATKAKAKRKPRKRVLSETQKKKVEAQKKRVVIKNLKVTALQPPTGMPSTAWEVFSQEAIRGHKLDRLGAKMKELSTQYKNISPEQLEHYNHIANQNKVKNSTAYRQWIESHTPAEIHAANLARQNLKRQGVKGYTNKLQDDRQVKFATNPYSLFNQERWSSGDLKGLKIAEAARLVAREWKALSADEKKPYKDRAQQDMVRYTQERKTVLNKDVTHNAQAATAA